MVVLETAVRGEAGRDGLVPAVHRHEVDVHIDEQVALGRVAVDLDILPVGSKAEVDEIRGILGVMLQEEPTGRECLEHAVAEGMAQLGIGHATVKGKRSNQHDVIDPCLGRKVQDRLDDALGVHRVDASAGAAGRCRRRQW